MPTDPPLDFTPAEQGRALQIAADDGRTYIDWPDLFAARLALQAQNEPTTPTCQMAPNPAKARQPVPPRAAAQNEPTAENAPHPPRLPSELPPRAKQCQQVPNDANARHAPRIDKTNPLALSAARPPRPLTPGQLRAARLLLAGHSTTAIAATLHINRHTLARWKHLPLFQRELRRLVDSDVQT